MTNCFDSNLNPYETPSLTSFYRAGPGEHENRTSIMTEMLSRFGRHPINFPNPEYEINTKSKYDSASNLKLVGKSTFPAFANAPCRPISSAENIPESSINPCSCNQHFCVPSVPGGYGSIIAKPVFLLSPSTADTVTSL